MVHRYVICSICTLDIYCIQSMPRPAKLYASKLHASGRRARLGRESCVLARIRCSIVMEKPDGTWRRVTGESDDGKAPAYVPTNGRVISDYTRTFNSHGGLRNCRCGCH
jgi:hypothetical protein